MGLDPVAPHLVLIYLLLHACAFIGRPPKFGGTGALHPRFNRNIGRSPVLDFNNYALPGCTVKVNNLMHLSLAGWPFGAKVIKHFSGGHNWGWKLSPGRAELS